MTNHRLLLSTIFLLFCNLIYSQTITIVSTGGSNEGTGWSYSNGVISPNTLNNVNINSADIVSKLSQGNLTVQSTNASITISSSITSSNSNSLTFKAAGNILQNTGAKVTTNGGDITYWSDSDNSGQGAIVVGTSNANGGEEVVSNGGNIILSGGENVTTGYAKGAVGFLPWIDKPYGGVSIFHANINAKAASNVGGNITIRGSVSNVLGAVSARGLIVTNSNILTQGSGTINIDGSTTNFAGANPWGVIIEGYSVVETFSGNLDISGTGSNASANSRGVVIAGGSLTSQRPYINAKGGSTINITDKTNSNSANFSGSYLSMAYIGQTQNIPDAAYGSGRVNLISDKFQFDGGSVRANFTQINTNGEIYIHPFTNSFKVNSSDASIPQIFEKLAFGNPSYVQIGKSTNTSPVFIGGTSWNISFNHLELLDIYAGNITFNRSISGEKLRLFSSGSVTQLSTVPLNFWFLETYGSGSTSLNNTSNQFKVLTAGTTSTPVGNLTIVTTEDLLISDSDLSGLIGINSTGTIVVRTYNGADIDIDRTIKTTNNTNSAILIQADFGMNANSACDASASGGKVYFGRIEANIDIPASGRARIFSSAPSESTHLNTKATGGIFYLINTGNQFISNLPNSGVIALYRADNENIIPVTPTFNAVGPFCSGTTIGALPTTSLNGVSGLWSPAINNTTTTTYTFTPTAGQCATSTTLTIVIESLPIVNAGSELNAVVQGGATAAMGGSVTGATGGIWSGGLGTWTNATNPATATYTAGASEFGSVTLTLTSTGGACNAVSATKNLQVNLTQGAAPSNSVKPHVSASQFNSSVNVNDNVNLTLMPNTSEYRIKITGSNTGGWNNNVIVFDRPTNNFTFQQHVPGFIYGTQYTVEVAHKINGSSVFGNYGTPSLITVNVPSPKLTTTWCNTNISFNTLVNSTVAFDASEYRFRITGPNSGGNGWNNNVFILDRPTNNFSFQQHVPGFFYGVPYTVEVAFKQTGTSTFSNFGSVCTLTVNAPSTQLSAAQCNGSVNAISNVNASWIFSAVEYRFKITGPNVAGNGWNNNVYILDRPVNNFTFVQHVPGFVYGAQYSVEVAYRQAGSSTFLSYGPSCDITVNIPSSQLTTTFCGNNAVSFNTNVIASQVWFAAEYRFKITGSNNGAPGWNNNVFILNRPTNSFNFLQHVPGSLFGAQYSVEVAYRQAGSLEFGNYGSLCNLTLVQPVTQIQSSQCGITGVQPETTVFANAVAGAAGYRFKFVGANITNWNNNTFILDRPIRTFWFDLVSGSLPGEVYEVSVAVMDANGNYGPYGSVCNITRFGVPQLPVDENNVFVNDKTLEVVSFSSTANPNPFTSEFGIQVLNANDSELIHVSIYDISGKLIEREVVNPMDIEQARFGKNLSSGMYMIEVKQGSNQSVFRQMKN